MVKPIAPGEMAVMSAVAKIPVERVVVAGDGRAGDYPPIGYALPQTIAESLTIVLDESKANSSTIALSCTMEVSVIVAWSRIKALPCTIALLLTTE